MRTSSLCLLLLAFFLVVTTIAAQSSSSSSSSSGSSSSTGAVAPGGAGAGSTTGTTTKPATATLNWFHGWNYIFALGLIFAFWDAYGIGANDVANSFATSVGSKSLTLFQACMIACVVEFLGAILVGSAVADTIRGKLIDVNLFKGNPALLALVMLSALIGSSTWVLAATRFGFPVSTTHSIVGAVMGSAIAAYGPDVIRWSYEGNGFSQIVASWFISPALASAIASGVFLSVEFIVLRSNNPFQRGLWTIPFYFGGTTCLIVFAFIYKGSPALKLDTKFTQDEAGAIAGGIGAFFFLFAIVAYMPWLKKRVLAWEQEEMAKAAAEQESVNNAALAPAGSGDIALSVIPSSDEGNNGDDITKPTQVTFHDKDLDTETATKLAADAEEGVGTIGSSTERNSSTDLQKSPPAYTSSSPTNAAHEKHQSQHDLLSKQQYHEDNWIIPVRDCLIGVPIRIWNQLRYGLTVDVTHHPQLEEMHNRAPKFDNKTERMYSFLQILTATFASFSHGSNDVANAVAPLSTIYYVYEHSWNTNVPSKTDVPLWIYAFCGIALNIGLLTYGYNIMRELGNKLTYHSPARGFSMELGAAISVLVASRQGWPVSTTHCITGATIGVGLCARDPKAVNWWRASAYFFGWLITVPAAGLMAGLTFAIIAYSPKSYTTSQNGY